MFDEVTVPAGFLIGGLVGGLGGYILGGAEARSAYNGKDILGSMPDAQ